MERFSVGVMKGERRKVRDAKEEGRDRKGERETLYVRVLEKERIKSETCTLNILLNRLLKDSIVLENETERERRGRGSSRVT